MKKKRKKVLPSYDYLKNHFTEISLAHWIMGSDYWENDGKTLFLCTECLTLAEVLLLVQLLQESFSLKAGLKRRVLEGRLIGYCIRLSMKKANLKKLQNWTLPHLHLGMLYKIGV